MRWARSSTRHGRDEVLPQVGEHRRRAALVEPVELLAAQREDAAQHEFGDALGMRLGVRQRERAPPRSAEDLPPIDAEVVAQALHVGDEMPRGVGREVGPGLARVRDRESAAALVEQHDAVPRGVEEPAVHGRRAGPRSAVQEHHGLALAVARDLPVDVLSVPHVEHARLERLDLRIQVSHDLTVTTSGCPERMPRRAAARTRCPIRRRLSGSRPSLPACDQCPIRWDPDRSPCGTTPVRHGSRRSTSG